MHSAISRMEAYLSPGKLTRVRKAPCCCPGSTTRRHPSHLRIPLFRLTHPLPQSSHHASLSGLQISDLLGLALHVVVTVAQQAVAVAVKSALEVAVWMLSQQGTQGPAGATGALPLTEASARRWTVLVVAARPLLEESSCL